MRRPSEQVMLKVLTNRRRDSPASPLTEVAVAAVCTKTQTSLASRAKSKGLSRRALRLLSIAVFLVIGFALAGCSGSEEGKNEEESQAPSQEEVQSALEQAVAAGIPGIAVEIRGPEGSEFLAAGVASLEDEQLLTPEDRFRIASVTKAFTAAVVMELVEEGTLSLDDPVEDWAPGLLAEGDSITVRHLLAHTSGLPDYTKDEEFIEAFVAGEDLPPQQIVSFVSSEPLAFEPGTTYEYSDTDNIVLGMIIEAATGRSYEQELHSRILEPLGLQATTFPSSAQMPDPHAQGYQYDPEGGGAGSLRTLPRHSIRPPLGPPGHSSLPLATSLASSVPCWVESWSARISSSRCRRQWRARAVLPGPA